jgi:hypothetical protein
MSRVRDVMIVVVCGIVLTVVGAGAASATESDCTPPAPSECATACTSGLDLSGLVDGLLGGLLGGGCC